MILHSPAKHQHLRITTRVSKLLDTYVSLRSLGVVNTEKCLCVFPRNDYEPDIVFFGVVKSASLKPDTLKFPVPDLAVEVLSSSTEARERGVKFEDYAANGVGEYWIIDAEAATLEQYLLQNETYQLSLKSGSGQLKSEVITGLTIPLEALFDDQKNLAALRGIMAEA
jgi:Uma2 family endonuclease